MCTCNRIASTIIWKNSASAYHRILEPARTIADLAGEEAIRPLDLAEALQYRPRTNA